MSRQMGAFCCESQEVRPKPPWRVARKRQLSRPPSLHDYKITNSQSTPNVSGNLCCVISCFLWYPGSKSLKKSYLRSLQETRRPFSIFFHSLTSFWSPDLVLQHSTRFLSFLGLQSSPHLILHLKQKVLNLKTTYLYKLVVEMKAVVQKCQIFVKAPQATATRASSGRRRRPGAFDVFGPGSAGNARPTRRNGNTPKLALAALAWQGQKIAKMKNLHVRPSCRGVYFFSGAFDIVCLPELPLGRDRQQGVLHPASVACCTAVGRRFQVGWASQKLVELEHISACWRPKACWLYHIVT